MNIIIPIGGKGERFKNRGYAKSKPLIDILNKPMIFHVLDNLKFHEGDDVYIIYNKVLDDENFCQIINSNYPKINLIKINEQTKGASETIYLGLKNGNIKQGRNKNIIVDCDTFYQDDILEIYRKSNHSNVVFFSKNINEKPIYSYISIDPETHRIIEIKEKQKISDNANTGAYCFENLEELSKYCEIVLANESLYANNEPYTSCVISEMMRSKSSGDFYGIELNNYDIVSLGTPDDVDNYVKNTRALLFDLDGTLVNTDHIYVEVWIEILRKYNIKCDETFFNNFIKGKNDASFLKYIIAEITDKEIQEISEKKDSLFIEKMKQKDDFLFPGVADFFKRNKQHKIAIVTSSNRKSALFILKMCDLEKHVDLVIASEDCSNNKPHPDPYLKAMEYFNIDKTRTFIFEDSYSGLCSAKNSGAKHICLIENDKSCSEIRKSDNYKFNNYENLNINEIADFYNSSLYNNAGCSNLIEKIKQHIITIPFTKIQKNQVIIKTGYICDINSYNIEYTNGDRENVIVKISNLENKLSDVALELNMYENESYFYSNISNLIATHVPKFFGTFLDNGKEVIILEDLHKYAGKFNIDLNKNITVLMNVINCISNIHNKFYYENVTQVISSMKKLKTVNEISYYKKLIRTRYETFILNTKFLLNASEKNIVKKIYDNMDSIYEKSSSYPLSFCHGDLKSPNIFYKNGEEPIFLDWQYTHLNKGVSDLAFLLIESITFDPITVDLAVNYYYKLQNENHPISHEKYMEDFKNALCIFPFFVCVWFNSEDVDTLLDPIFPIKFMKNLMKYYNHYL
jgi:HAD superfamily hydrolase (TIGR01509 family)